MSDLVTKRLDNFALRLDTLEKRMAETATSSQLSVVAEKIDQTRRELADHMRQVELRLGTAVHGVLAAVQDLKSWHQERDDVSARMQRLEARLAELEQRA